MKAVAVTLSLGLMALFGLYANAAANGRLGTSGPIWESTPYFLPIVAGKPVLTLTPTLTPSPTINPSRLPDLEPIAYGFRYDGPCPWGQPGIGWAWVRNSSGENAGPFSVYFNISEGPTLIPVPGLALSATAEVSMALQSGPPSGVIIHVDYENQIMEGNEANNLLELMFTPPPQCTLMGTTSPGH